MKEHAIIVDSARCVGCGLCVRDCPEHNIEVKNGKAVIQEQNCMKCGHCVAICPKAAVSMTGFDEPPVEIFAKPILDHEQLLQAIKTRRSIRRFTNKPVADGVIREIIEAGRFTPTAKNAQNVSYIVLNHEMGKYEKIAVSFFRRLLPIAKLFYPAAKKVAIDDAFFFKKAPVAILVLSNDRINGSLAASNMALMAEANGLGVLFSGFFSIAANYSPALRKALSLKRNKVVTTLVLGYPDVRYRRTAPKETAAVRFL